MASRGKKKTTAAKLNREGKLRERRAIKSMKKDQRRAEADLRRSGDYEEVAEAPLDGEPAAE